MPLSETRRKALDELCLNLAEKGFIPKEELATLRQAGSRLRGAFGNLSGAR